MPIQEIEAMKNSFIEHLLPRQIYLFGSFADNTYTDSSDFDFYIVVSDGVSDLADAAAKAYRSVRKIKTRPVDILVGTQSRFENRKKLPSVVENEIYRKGILLYDAGNE